MEKYSNAEAQRVLDEKLDHFRQKVRELLPQKDWDIIHDTYLFAADAHKNQERKSGLPYIVHPIDVATIALEELGLKTHSVQAALLHDVVEDTEHTLDEIRERYGEDVATLVGVLTKKISENYKVSKQVDNFRLMLNSINYDIRALLIKLSDRLNNMRTLGSMRTDKQMKIASETDYFYAPLANRLGLYEIKSELENLSMKFRSPQEYARIDKKIQSYMNLYRKDIEDFLKPIRVALAKEGFHASVYARPRSVYALWRQMQSKKLSFKELEHVHLVQIVFASDKSKGSDKDQCLKIYSIITDLYKERPYSMINYVDQPKENGYQALHVQLMTKRGGWSEVHITTEEMHKNSQQGCVMHSSESIEQWVEKFKGILKDIARSSADSDFMKSVVSSFYNDDIIVFTPKGAPVVLPKGSSVLDLAYEIHTNLGNKAKFARINGKLSSIFTTLKRGDRVEVGTSDEMTPLPDWINHVHSYKARRSVKLALEKDTNAKEVFPYKVCPQCHPLPGDEVMGFRPLDGKELIEVHKRNCPLAIELSAGEGDNIVDVSLPVRPYWTYETRISIDAVDRAGLLRDVVDVITTRLGLYINSLETFTQDYIVSTHVTLLVTSAFELDAACRTIEQVKGVEEVRTN